MPWKKVADTCNKQRESFDRVDMRYVAFFRGVSPMNAKNMELKCSFKGAGVPDVTRSREARVSGPRLSASSGPESASLSS